jgi:hypothetical protein
MTSLMKEASAHILHSELDRLSRRGNISRLGSFPPELTLCSRQKRTLVGQAAVHTNAISVDRHRPIFASDKPWAAAMRSVRMRLITSFPRIIDRSCHI